MKATVTQGSWSIGSKKYDFGQVIHDEKHAAKAVAEGHAVEGTELPVHLRPIEDKPEAKGAKK